MTNLRIKLSIFINFFLFAILMNSVGTVILQVQRYFGVLESSAAVLEICKDVSLAAASFAVASFIIAIGYKKSMLIALAVMTVACFTIPFVKSFIAIKILFALTGACFGLMKISILGSIGLVTKNEKEHLSMMNFIESFFMIGILAGYLIFSNYINDADAGSGIWFNVYYLLGTFSAIAFFLQLFSPLDETPVKKEGKSSVKEEVAGMMKLVFVPLIILFVSSVFLYTLVEQSIMCWLPTFNNKQLQLASSMSIQASGILAFSIAAGRFFAGFIMKKVNWFKVLIFCLLAISILVMVTLPFTSQPSDKQINNWSQVPVVAYIFPLIGFFLAPVYPVINSVVLSSLPANKHALMAGLIIIFSSAGGMSGSVITGFIFQSYGGKTAFYFSLVPIGILMVMLFIFRVNKEKRNGTDSYKNLRVALG